MTSLPPIFPHPSIHPFLHPSLLTSLHSSLPTSLTSSLYPSLPTSYPHFLPSSLLLSLMPPSLPLYHITFYHRASCRLHTRYLYLPLGGSLQDLVKMGGCQNPIVIQNISRQILLGVNFLHSLRLIHRDLKPSNALISSSGKWVCCVYS